MGPFLNRPLTVADLLGDDPTNTSPDDDEKRFYKLRDSIRVSMAPTPQVPSTSRVTVDPQQPSTSKLVPQTVKIQVGTKRPLQKDGQQPGTSKCSPPQSKSKTSTGNAYQEDEQRPSTSKSVPIERKLIDDNQQKSKRKEKLFIVYSILLIVGSDDRSLQSFNDNYIAILTNLKEFFNRNTPRPSPPLPPSTKPPKGKRKLNTKQSIYCPIAVGGGRVSKAVPLKRTKWILEKRRKFLREFRSRLGRLRQRHEQIRNALGEKSGGNEATIKNARVTVRVVEPQRRRQVEDLNQLQHNGSPVIRVLLRNDFEKDNYTQLKKLSFRGYKGVSDAALGVLTQMKLDLLDVTGTSCTETGVVEFQVNNPQCRVLHECACVCKPRMHF